MVSMMIGPSSRIYSQDHMWSQAFFLFLRIAPTAPFFTKDILQFSVWSVNADLPLNQDTTSCMLEFLQGARLEICKKELGVKRTKR